METRSATVTFLGVGSAGQVGLGHASAVVELGGQTLLIDCGPGTLLRFREQFQKLPDAVYITHCHLDHIGDFEGLFISSWFHQPERHQPKLYVPAPIIPLLHERVATYPNVLAEGGVNFWDAFQLIPVSKQFIFADTTFETLAVRHHAPNSAFGLRLPQAFFYTGDTRPIPEVLAHQISEKETIFHDCGVLGNPSHTGISDVIAEYSKELRDRMYCYHYGSDSDKKKFAEHNLNVISPGETFQFNINVESESTL